MRLQDLYIDGFGIWHHYPLTAISPGLTIIYGPNEAGKSTLAAFIRTILFGFPKGRTRERRYPPLRGGRLGGWIAASWPEGTYRVERLERQRGQHPHLSITDPHDNAVPEERLQTLLGRVDKQVFTNVFAFGLDELSSFDSLSSDDIKQKLYAAPIQGAGVSVQKVLKRLDDQRSALFTNHSNSKARLNELARRITETQARLDDARRQIDDYAALDREIDGIGHQIAAIEHDCQKTEAARRQHEQLINVWPTWCQLKASESDLADLLVIPAMAPDGLERLAKFGERTQSLKTSLHETQKGYDTTDRALAALSPRDQILDRAADLRSLYERRTLAREWLDRLSIALGRAQQAEAIVADRLRELGGTWQVETVEAFDVSVARRHRVQAWRDDLQKATDDCKEAQRRLDGHHEELRKLRERLDLLRLPDEQEQAMAKDEIEHRQRALSTLRSLMADHGRVDERVRSLQDRLAEARSDQSASCEPSGAATTKPPIWLWVTAIALVILAAVCAWTSQWLATGALIFAAVAVAVMAMQAKTPPATQSVETNQAKEQRVADLEQQLHGATAHLDGIVKQMAEAGETLGLRWPIESPHLDQVGADLSEAVNRQRALSSVQEQHHSLTLQIQRQEDLTDEAEAALTAARSGQQETRDAWLAWKQELNLDPDLTPDGVLVFFDALRNAQDQLIAQKQHQTEWERIQNDLRAFRAEADVLSEALGELAPIDDTLLINGIEKLHDRLVKAEQTEAERARLRQEITALQPKLERERTELQTIDTQLQALLDEAGAATPEAFRENWEVAQKRQYLLDKQKSAELTLQEVLGLGNHAVELRHRLATGEIMAWQQQLEGLEAQLQAQREEWGRLQRQHEAALQQRERLAQSADLIRHANDLTTLQEEHAQALREWHVLTLAHTLLADTLQRYEREKQPAVLQRASGHFAKVTDGAYEGVRTRDQKLEIVDRNGGRHSTEALSRGTAEQLYLCMRIGLAAELADNGSGLPFIMDDVLVNFDAERARQTAAMLLEVARTHQVILFTCHDTTVHLFQSLDTNVPVVSLPRFAGAGMPAARSQATDDRQDEDSDDDLSETPSTGHSGRARIDTERTNEVCRLISAEVARSPGQAKAQLIEATGITDNEWTKAIKLLREDGLVIQEGEKKAARYYPPVGTVIESLQGDDDRQPFSHILPTP